MTTDSPNTDRPQPPDPSTRLMPYGRILTIAPEVAVEAGAGRTPDEAVATVRFAVNWT